VRICAIRTYRRPLLIGIRMSLRELAEELARIFSKECGVGVGDSLFNCITVNSHLIDAATI
jgi:hypothetical protein